MFLTFKKRALISGILAVILCASAITITIAVKANSNPTGPTIVIDAGHGGMDGGVSGVKTGTKESDINLAIARSLKHIFKNRGYNVVMTRSNSDALATVNGKLHKLRDMEARRDIINNAKPAYVVSIHCNSYPLSSVKGAQVFYAPTSKDGAAHAKIMQTYLNSISQAKPRTAAKGDYYILQCSEYPTLLAECGFLSNSSEEALLVSASYQEKLAYAIFSAIHSILNQEANQQASA